MYLVTLKCDGTRELQRLVVPQIKGKSAEFTNFRIQMV